MDFFSDLAYIFKETVVGVAELAGEVVEIAGAAIDLAIGGLANTLGGKSYDKEDISDHINVDQELAQFRNDINDKVSDLENKRIEEIGTIFSNLKKSTQSSFPDLVEIINDKQTNVSIELKGTMMQYVREHISQNDDDFRTLLEMPKGYDKTSAINREIERITNEAQIYFYKRLVNYVKVIQQDFEYRLKSRINEQTNQLNERILFLEKLEKQAKDGNVDKVAVESRSIPIMESAECMRVLLETEK